MALIRTHFGGEPEKLDDITFAKLVTEALWLERMRAERQEVTIIKALYEATGKLKIEDKPNGDTV